MAENKAKHTLRMFVVKGYAEVNEKEFLSALLSKMDNSREAAQDLLNRLPRNPEQNLFCLDHVSLAEGDCRDEFRLVDGQSRNAASGYYTYKARHLHLRDVSVIKNKLLVWPETGKCNISNVVWSVSYMQEALVFKANRGVLPVPTTCRKLKAAHYLPSHQNVAHLVHELLPRAAWLCDNPDGLPIFVGDRAPSESFLNFLGFLGLGDLEILTIDPGERVSFETLAFTDTMDSSQLSTVSPMCPVLLARAVEKIKAKVVAETSGQPEKIYISRRDTNKRPIGNEARLEEIAKESGFTVITLTGMSLVDQIRLFANARIVAGGHGQGLCHFIWGRPGVRLVELNTKPYPNTMHYARLSVACASSYVEITPASIHKDAAGEKMYLFSEHEFRKAISN